MEFSESRDYRVKKPTFAALKFDYAFTQEFGFCNP